MSKRFFYVVYIGDQSLQMTLDAIRLIANPKEKGLAHITVRGPYDEQPKLNNKTLAVEKAEVRITGTSDFFDQGQNTVYLICECEALHERWYKPSFPDYRPHITIYDGPSREFAAAIRTVLREQPVQGTFRATRLSPLISEKGAPNDSLRRALDAAGISSLLKERITVSDLDSLSDERRIELIKRLWQNLACKLRDEQPCQQNLFAFDSLDYSTESPKRRLLDLHEVVAEGYRNSNQGCSVDRVITDPDANARFVQNCWKLGAQASQYELNRALLNARKSGLIGKTRGVERYSIPRQELDSYIFASEIALRVIQDEEWLDAQRRVSLDRILCEPALSYRFNQLASTLSPGFTNAQYRWAAMAIRKSQCRGPATSRRLTLRDFDPIGNLRDLRRSALPSEPGLYCLRRYGKSMYFGQADNLRSQIDRLATLRFNELPVVYEMDLSTRGVQVGVVTLPDLSSTARDSHKARLIFKNDPALNVRIIRRIG